MNAEEVAFVGALVHRFPALTALLREHLAYYDALLPRAFMGDVTRWAVAKQRAGSPSELAPFLEFVESCYRQGTTEEQELISVSFLENLPGPEEPGGDLRSALGPQLAEQLRCIG